jgi:hypothetical protein
MGTMARTMGRAATVLMAAASVVLPASPPAVAGTVQPQTGSSGWGSQASKMAFVGCPAGRRPVGVGGDLDGAVHFAGLVRLPVRPDGLGVNAIAEEGVEFKKNWTVRAFAFCHVAPAQWQVVSAVTTPGSLKTRSVTATCPAGTRVLGVGGGVLAGDGEVVLDDLRIGADLSDVRVTGTEDGDGFAGQWRVQAQAICAAPQAGQQRVQATSATDSTGSKRVLVRCPLGRQAHGIGAEMTGAQGQVRIRSLHPEKYSGGRGVEVVANEDLDGFSGSWSLTVYAVCAI